MSLHPLLKFDISELSIAERIQLAEDLWDSILGVIHVSLPKPRNRGGYSCCKARLVNKKQQAKLTRARQTNPHTSPPREPQALPAGEEK